MWIWWNKINIGRGNYEKKSWFLIPDFTHLKSNAVLILFLKKQIDKIIIPIIQNILGLTPNQKLFLSNLMLLFLKINMEIMWQWQELRIIFNQIYLPLYP